jgi:hypothetical protein
MDERQRGVCFQKRQVFEAATVAPLTQTGPRHGNAPCLVTIDRRKELLSSTEAL